MSEESRRVRPSSVASFLFMPQLRLSFQHFSFIVPVFIRTVAVIFVQAGLLPRNHPALQYGMEGVKRYGFFELMGEAWYHLRTTRATPAQWSMYSAVVLMVAFMALSAGSTMLNVGSLAVSTAKAQLFDNRLGGGSDIASMAVPAGAGLFNQQAFNTAVTPFGNAQGEYALRILNTLLRESMASPQQGGPLQNNFAGLMGVYNSGVLVIAGVMLFWAILSVVVDTAKTGHLGGGRHNMVWAPIRIVFGLGLLIPLGAAGYNSGQYMVVKLAEWGSNLGSRVWYTYINGVASDATLVQEPTIKNLSDLVVAYEKMWLCRTAYNGVTQQTMGTIPAAQEITTIRSDGMFNIGVRAFQFTNSTDSNICGTITYKTPYDLSVLWGQSLAATSVERTVSDFKIAMYVTYQQLFINDDGTDGPLAVNAKKFACDFVEQHILPNSTSTPNDSLSVAAIGCPAATPGGAGQCSGTVYPGPPDLGHYPDMAGMSVNPDAAPSVANSCMAHMIYDAWKWVSDGINAAVTTATGSATANMLQLAGERGWAGMGLWYHEINTINTTVLSADQPSVTITSGDYKQLYGAGKIDMNHALKVAEVLHKFDKWWETVPLSSTVQQPTSAQIMNSQGAAPASKPPGKTLGDGVKGVVSSLMDGSSMGVFDAIAGLVLNKLFDLNGSHLFDIARPSDPNSYPLSQLSKVGYNIQAMAITLIALASVTQALLGLADAEVSILGFGGSLGDLGLALAESIIFSFLQTVGLSLLSAGMLLVVYVPLLPLVRSAFAVLTWMVAVFEAVVMVPIAALAHLTTEGEGLALRTAGWVIWLNILLRPTLTVIGYVGALLVFNTFVLYWHDLFGSLAIANQGGQYDGAMVSIIKFVGNTIIYVGVIYMAANSLFKLMDIIPAALFKYMGGQPDTSFDNDMSGMVSHMGRAAGDVAGGAIAGGGRMGKMMGTTAENLEQAALRGKST